MELTDLRRAEYFNSARALGSLVAAPHPYPVHNGLKVVLKSFIICEYTNFLVNATFTQFRNESTLLGDMPIEFIGNYFVMFYTKHKVLEFIGIYIE